MTLDVRPEAALAPAATEAGVRWSVQRTSRPRLRAVLLGAILPVALVAIWWGISASGSVPAYRLPSPQAVVLAALDLSQRGLLYTDIAISTQRVFLGFAIGAVIGLALGAVVGLSRVASDLLSPTIGAFRAVPSLAWLALLALYLGIFEPPKITIIAIGALFPVFTTVAGALRHVDPHLVELGRAYGLRGFSLFRAVQLPAVIPSVVSGLRLALAQAWLFLVAAELLASSIGLGHLLTESSNNGRVDRIFLAIILLAVLGKATDGLIGLLERLLRRIWT